MSIQDEHELRDRLGGLLHGIEPGLAPVAGTMRRGKGIRMRRWISAAAGLAVVAAGAVILPGQLQHHPAAPTVPLHYSVTVSPVSTEGQGTDRRSGHHERQAWQVICRQNGATAVTADEASASQVLACGRGQGGQARPRLRCLRSASAGRTELRTRSRRRPCDAGRSGACSNGTRLTPASAGRRHGRRWIGFSRQRR